MFGKKKPVKKLEYNRAENKPVLPMIRASICNGEQVAGLKNLQTGVFEEVMLIHGPADLELFRQMTGQTDIPKEY